MSNDPVFLRVNEDKAVFDLQSKVDNHLAPKVTIISSDNVKVKGHSVILGSCPYLRKLMNKDKTGDSHLVLDESLSGDVLEFVAKYSLLDVDKLPQVLPRTSEEKYNIPELAKCYLRKQLDAPGGLNQANWHIFYKNGINFSLGEEYCNRIYAFLIEEHPEFYKSEEFRDLTYEQICKIMRSPNRPFESIATIMEATLIWATENKVGMDKLAELSKFCTNPVQVGSNEVDVYHPPKYSWESAQLLFFGQAVRSEPGYIWSYSFQGKEIKKVARLPFENLWRSSLFVSQDRIYSFGGFVNHPESDGSKNQNFIMNFAKIDLGQLDKSWDKGPKLTRSRVGPSTLRFRNTIYLFPGNGATLDSGIDTWNIGGMPWTFEENDLENEMFYIRSCFGVALLDNVIYMVGGMGKDKKFTAQGIDLNSAESYNIDDGTQSLLPNMSQGRWNLQLVALKDRIYAIGGKNLRNIDGLTLVESYKPGDSSWTQVASMNQPRALGIKDFVLDDMIYVVGGNKGEPTMERYSPQEDRWTMVDINLPQWAELSSFALIGPNKF